MLKRRYKATRLNIGETIKTGFSISGNFLYAKLSKKETEKTGFAVVISKKNEKTSVGRHLIIRRIVGCIEDNLPKINPDFKKTVVFFIKNNPKPANYKDIRKDVDFIFVRINELHQPHK